MAYEEVENTLVAYALEQHSARSLRQAADASSKAVNLVGLQYRSGLTNFQNFLDMQRFLFRQEDELAVSEGRVIQNLISLYTVLGAAGILMMFHSCRQALLVNNPRFDMSG